MSKFEGESAPKKTDCFGQVFLKVLKTSFQSSEYKIGRPKYVFIYM